MQERNRHSFPLTGVNPKGKGAPRCARLGETASKLDEIPHQPCGSTPLQAVPALGDGFFIGSAASLNAQCIRLESSAARRHSAVRSLAVNDD